MAEKIETYIKTGYQPKFNKLDRTNKDYATIKAKNQELYDKGKARLQDRILRMDVSGSDLFPSDILLSGPEPDTN